MITFKIFWLFPWQIKIQTVLQEDREKGIRFSFVMDLKDFVTGLRAHIAHRYILWEWCKVYTWSSSRWWFIRLPFFAVCRRIREVVSFGGDTFRWVTKEIKDPILSPFLFFWCGDEVHISVGIAVASEWWDPFRFSSSIDRGKWMINTCSMCHSNYLGLPRY